MRGRAGGATVFVAVTLVAPVVAGAALVVAQDRSPLESADPPAAVVAQVVGASRTGETSVGVTLRTSDAPPVRTAASGMVTQVHVAAGQQVTTGAVLVTVGDVDVVACTSPRPLHVDLAEGDTGPAVSVAQQVLADQGMYRGAVDGRAGASTTRAVVAFNTAHGLGRAPVLSLASLAWLGPAPVTARSVEVRAGDLVGPGTDLFATAATYAAVDVTPQGATLPDADLVLEVQGRTAPLDRATMAVTDPVFVAEVAAALGPQGAAGGGTGTVRLATPVQVGVVPASAVVVDDDGRTCLFGGVDDDPLEVVPLGGSLGTVEVDAALVGRSVLVNPREVRAAVGCD